MRAALLLLPYALAATALATETPTAPSTDTVTAEAPQPGACPAPRGPGRGAWSTRTLPETAERAAAKAALESWAFPEISAEAEANRQGIRTDGLLIIHKGELVYERYGRGFTAETPHLTWSVSKTYTATLTGIAVQRGLLSLDDSICEHITPTSPTHCETTVKDLLEFGSGTLWKESYESSPPTTSSVVAMLYGQGHEDVVAFATAQPRRAPPGSFFQYSSGDTNVLSGVVGAALTPVGGDQFPWTLLFEPMGDTSAVWERDTKGTYIGSSYVYATPRDMARLGMLWLDDGCYAGERWLPEGWVAASSVVSETIQRGSYDREPGDTQGRQVWLNQPVYALGDAARPWPGSPPDYYGAMGHWKQGILMVPSHDLVIVRTGDDRDGSFSWDLLAQHAIALVDPSAAPPAADPPPPPGLVAATNQIAEPLEFDTGLLRIAVNYGAKLGCSCAFVMNRDDAQCAAFVKASPDIVKVRYDREAKVAKATTFGLVRATASYRGPREGCTIDP
ncbi:beta-lactamase family protein [Myxococcota bacterium]|nr:beta-lactamase family protein [Myxococcota bacterium]